MLGKVCRNGAQSYKYRPKHFAPSAIKFTCKTISGKKWKLHYFFFVFEFVVMN